MSDAKFNFANFRFTLTFESDEFDDDASKEFFLTMLDKKKSKEIGTVEGHLIDRTGKVNSARFFERCDAISSELQGAGLLCCDNQGKLRPALSKLICDKQRVARASRGAGW